MQPTYYSPKIFLPPHEVTHPQKVIALANSMWQNGWRGPSLVAYRLPDNTGFQLLSGTHRQAAAIELNRMIPVVILPWDVVEAAWGTDRWRAIMMAGHDAIVS